MNCGRWQRAAQAFMCLPMSDPTNPEPTAKKSAAGFAKPVQPDAASAVVGSAPVTRTELTKKPWEYTRHHQWQDPAKKTQINADDS